MKEKAGFILLTLFRYLFYLLFFWLNNSCYTDNVTYTFWNKFS